MSLPKPRPGLVIGYSYLWAEEHQQGREEGVKDRPCAIVAARQIIEGKEVITVVPVTHAPPSDPNLAIEIPAAIKAHLRLDGLRSWIVLSETNDFIWPGPDIRSLPGTRPPQYSYGMLPPRFYAHVKTRVIELNRQRRLSRVTRHE